MHFIYPKQTCPVPTHLNPSLTPESISSPFDLFKLWFESALDTIPEANAIAIASCHNGQPANRVVYLRHWDENGFVFFTHLTSAKGHAFEANPSVEGLLYWRERWQQIRIGGEVEVISDELADTYFGQRPRASQIGAWASLQSQPLADAEAFDLRLAEAEQRFPSPEPVPRPSHWSGYRIVPSRFEFWQGLQARLHHRVTYTKDASGSWDKHLTYP